jgi:hypothetical protein
MLGSRTRTEALTQLYPLSPPSLRLRWCVLPKVTQGRQHVMAPVARYQHMVHPAFEHFCIFSQVSMGVKHPKNGAYHGFASVGAGAVTVWVLLRASLKRATQSWTSPWSMTPPLVVVLVGTDIFGSRDQRRWEGVHLRWTLAVHMVCDCNHNMGQRNGPCIRGIILYTCLSRCLVGLTLLNSYPAPVA